MTLGTFGFLFTGILLNAAAQLLLKAGVRNLGELSLSIDTFFSTAVSVGTQLPIIGGLFCYGISVFVWIIGLSRVDVTIAYPMLSLGYVINAVLAWYLFGEVLSMQRIIGITVILIGVWILARS